MNELILLWREGGEKEQKEDIKVKDRENVWVKGGGGSRSRSQEEMGRR